MDSITARSTHDVFKAQGRYDAMSDVTKQVAFSSMALSLALGLTISLVDVAFATAVTSARKCGEISGIGFRINNHEFDVGCAVGERLQHAQIITKLRERRILRQKCEA